MSSCEAMVNSVSWHLYDDEKLASLHGANACSAYCLSIKLFDSTTDVLGSM